MPVRHNFKRHNQLYLYNEQFGSIFYDFTPLLHKLKTHQSLSQTDIIFTQNFSIHTYKCTYCSLKFSFNFFCCCCFSTEKVISIIIIKFFQSFVWFFFSFHSTEYEMILKSNCYQGYFVGKLVANLLNLFLFLTTLTNTGAHGLKQSQEDLRQ